ncbi:cupin domain-containing protein [Cyanobium sp. Candia 9D4]|uniref:cupin domain-containing protein n=1 Tax=Cyanobium sp. Candia 9D4 TaxID=2823707 RepID=UPI0020CCF446|nr:cupin domain-containing protein [Cyanobium sp. Candia 9D4]MCP9933210.1 cupin domain-containing protein [Cyanobium sp. Candia 9D4]
MAQPTAQEVITLLGLEPHRTCGLVAQSFVSEAIPGGALYFLASPERGVQLHRIAQDQVYHHYLGDSLEVLLVSADGVASRHRVGSDLAAGQRPQLAIAAGTFHAGRVAAGGAFGYALLGTSVWGRVEPEGMERMELRALGEMFPGALAVIQAFASV